MSALPWHRWFHATWLASETRHSMTAAERGVYRDALDLCYSEGSIPADERTLQRLLIVSDEEFSEAWPAVSKHFEEHPDRPDRLINPKASEIMAESERYRRQQAAHGRKGGRPKGSENSKRVPFPDPSPTKRVSKAQEERSSSNEELPIIASGDAADGVCFDSWYRTFPRKVGKPAARKAFEGVIVKGKLPQGAVPADLDGLRAARDRFERLTATAAAWAREFERRPADKRPHPATFLNSLDWVAAPGCNGPALTDRGLDAIDELNRSMQGAA